MSGALTLMMGSGRIRVSLSNVSIDESVIAPAAASCGYQLDIDGDINHRKTGTGGAYVDSGDWITPKAAAGINYEARVTVTSGTLSSGTSGSWLPLNITRTWTVTAVSTIKTCTFTLEIREATSGTVVASASITITAESS